MAESNLFPLRMACHSLKWTSAATHDTYQAPTEVGYERPLCDQGMLWDQLNRSEHSSQGFFTGSKPITAILSSVIGRANRRRLMITWQRWHCSAKLLFY